jgi:Raf kinase inhibitor-like YbhB/YbcL family protein
MVRGLLILWVVFALSLGGVGCRDEPEPAQEGENEMAIQVTSSAFSEGETIPKKFTCDGENVSPALSWTGVPQGTKSLAVIADDPDAPVGDWVHWVLLDLPLDLNGLPEGASGLGVAGLNDFRKPGYGGPCPPKGKPHRYYFKVYALDTLLGLKIGATKAQAEAAMKGHILAQGQLMGRYSR